MKQIQQQPSIETTQETPYTVLHFWDLQYIFFPTHSNKKYCWLKICWSQKMITNIFQFFFWGNQWCFMSLSSVGFMDITFLGSRWFYLRPQRHPRCGLTCFVSKSTTFKFIVYVCVCVRTWEIGIFLLQGSHWDPYYIYMYIFIATAYIYIYTYFLYFLEHWSMSK